MVTFREKTSALSKVLERARLFLEQEMCVTTGTTLDSSRT